MKKVAIGCLILVSSLWACKSTNESNRTNIKILILGNSMTHHGPNSVLGWSGDWGMAASSMDKDFVHVLIRKLNDYSPITTIAYKEQNVADWEQKFGSGYDLSAYKELAEYNPDILIIRLGENVKIVDEAKYGDSLNKMIKYFKGSYSKVIITGNVWAWKPKDSIQEKVAIDNGYYFIDFSEISKEDENFAHKMFDNKDVSNHPSDIGMNQIADKIFNKIKKERLLQ